MALRLHRRQPPRLCHPDLPVPPLATSSTLATYRKLGVHLAGHLAQNGTLINKLIRTQYPNYRVLKSRASLIHIARTTYHQERFHIAALLFFLASTLYAAAQHHPAWAIILTLANIIYNLYPILLEQYIRLRLRHPPSRRPR